MSQVQIGLRAIVRNENFAVLIGIHRAGVLVEIRVYLQRQNGNSTGFEERGNRSHRNPLTQTGDGAPRHEYEFRMFLHLPHN